MPLKSKILTKAQQDLFNFMSLNHPEINLFDLTKSTPSNILHTPSNIVEPASLIATSVHNRSESNEPIMSFMNDDIRDAMYKSTTNVIDLADSLSDNNAIMIMSSHDGPKLYNIFLIYEYQGKLKSKTEKRVLF